MTTTQNAPLISLDDIVFEGRNKAYGAYVLRRIYGRHLSTAVVLATALAALLIAIPIAIQYLWPTMTVAADPLATLPPPMKFTDVVVPTTTPPPAAQHRAVIVRPPVNSVPTRVVPNEQAKPIETPPTNQEVIDIPTETGPVASTGGAVGVGNATGVGTSNDTSAKPAVATKVEPFIHVEEMPDFIGGQAALAKYLQRHLRYPAAALRESVSGKVFMSFTVNSDGTITDVQVLKGLGFGTEEEAARVISSMPAWKPGRQNNHAVPVRYTLPITFRYE
jgi:protein TonB